jgi:hypothetical protein
MGLDFHIAADLDEAQTSVQVYSVGLEEHHAFFRVLRLRPESYPVLERLGDFWSDATISPDEASQLLEELDRYKLTVGSPGFAPAFIKNLQNTARISIVRETPIFTFCD